MSGVIAILVRFIAIIAGFAVASLTASAFLHLLVFGGRSWSAGELPPDVAGSLIFSIPFVALFVASFAFLPSLAVIIFAEILRRRDWLTYAIGGALVGLAVAAFFAKASGPAAGTSISDPFSAGAIIGGGIVGGLVYWLVAGRGAGSWQALR